LFEWVWRIPAGGLAVSQLRLEGIPAMWKQTNLGASWLLGAGTGGGIMGPLAILVDPESAERARDLLEDPEGVDPEG
jgi:hypothetical protein